MKRLILKETPEKGDTATIDGVVITFGDCSKETHLEFSVAGKTYKIHTLNDGDLIAIDVDAQEVSETLTDAQSFWTDI